MPVLMFTAQEIAGSLIAQQRQLSWEIRTLADLEQKPLAPGESVAERHHKLAKLGKRLADAFDEYDRVMLAMASAAAGDEPAEPTPSGPTTPGTSQAN